MNELDLHGFTHNEAVRAAEDFLINESLESSIISCTIITGHSKDLQDKMKEAQEKIKNIEVEGNAGGNLVKVILSGDYELKSITISEKAKNEDQTIINDLIVAAYNNAKENLKKKSSEEISKITGGINLPFDIKFPS